jgi:hypothetical protein
MRIKARMSMSTDGFVTTPGGSPSQTADPASASGGTLSINTRLTFERSRPLPDGSVETAYKVGAGDALPGRAADWAPASQHRDAD